MMCYESCLGLPKFTFSKNPAEWLVNPKFIKLKRRMDRKTTYWLIIPEEGFSGISC